MKYARILKASQSASILAVIENLAIDQNGFFLDATQMDNIEAQLEAGETAVASAAGLTEQLAAAETARQTAEASLVTAQETITANNARITELEAQLAAAQEKPAAEFETATRERDAQGALKTPYHQREDNPANQLADGLLGKPKKTTA
jgi:septal ring factor EnvC (AmiA/AmiB activator)